MKRADLRVFCCSCAGDELSAETERGEQLLQKLRDALHTMCPDPTVMPPERVRFLPPNPLKSLESCEGILLFCLQLICILFNADMPCKCVMRAVDCFLPGYAMHVPLYVGLQLGWGSTHNSVTFVCADEDERRPSHVGMRFGWDSIQ